VIAGVGLIAAPEPAASVDWEDLAPVAIVSLDAEQIARLPLIAMPGPGDDAAWTGAHPLPHASADLPGTRAADRGGGASGGPDTWTGRRDPDQTALRAQLWNGAEDYRTPRADLDRRAATREAIARTPERAYGDRQARRVARAGDPVASRGDRADGTGAGQGLIAAPPSDAPDLEAAAGVTVPARVEGATRPTDEGALVDQGATATDVTRHGRTGDDVAVAAASSERNPDPFDLTPSRSGGASDGEGVRGKRNDDGALADGRGTGTAASTASAPRGKGGMSVFASRTDPYLRELLRRLDREIRFPRDLKLDLRSGRVIASLTLHADGTISDVTIATSSGYQGFDDELTRALRKLGPLGRAPATLLDGRRAIKVMVPYTFRNPMIR
jgi:TonB family protein